MANVRGCKAGLYTVRAGDTLGEIAGSRQISLQNLLRLNPQIIDPDIICAGQTICTGGCSAKKAG